MSMTAMNARQALRKFWRFMCIYGVQRAVFKALGRLRRPVRLAWWRASRRDIAIIGCGQFAFSTIGYFLYKRFGARIFACFDPNATAAATFAATYGVPVVAGSVEVILSNPDIGFVYIASNHASHTDYAIRALEAGKVVYVEKPVSVSLQQFERLQGAVRQNHGRIFVGYNRPFSAAIEHVKQAVGKPSGGLTLACYVSGHVIGPDHWYRDDGEGTRICGNAGHWIDLFVYLLSWRGIPESFEIQLLHASSEEPDDNFCLAVRSSEGDLFSLVLSSRTEPFEGINETVNIQWDSTIAKIDDFRKLTLWQEDRLHTKRFWPKDVGHRRAVLQPFSEDAHRDWRVVEISTILMLRIAEMTKRTERSATFSVSEWQPPRGTGRCLP
ncbi:MAG: Gfo/Idh/MocA family protein [Tabrizicola sp.]